PSARPSTSKPGPRLAEVAGTRTSMLMPRAYPPPGSSTYKRGPSAPATTAEPAETAFVTEVEESPDRDGTEAEDNDHRQGEVDGRQVVKVLRSQDAVDSPDAEHERPGVDNKVVERPEEDGISRRRRDQEHQQHGEHADVARPLEGELERLQV